VTSPRPPGSAPATKHDVLTGKGNNFVGYPVIKPRRSSFSSSFLFLLILLLLLPSSEHLNVTIICATKMVLIAIPSFFAHRGQ